MTQTPRQQQMRKISKYWFIFFMILMLVAFGDAYFNNVVGLPIVSILVGLGFAVLGSAMAYFAEEFSAYQREMQDKQRFRLPMTSWIYTKTYTTFMGFFVLVIGLGMMFAGASAAGL